MKKMNDENFLHARSWSGSGIHGSASAFIRVHLRLQSLLPLVALLIALPAAAEVTVSEAWARSTVAAQTSTGAYMKLKSSTPAKVVAASSPIAGVVEIHEMKMQGNVMTMGAVPALALPAGKVVELKPGGYHVMIMALKKPLAKGELVPIALTIEDAAGRRSTLEVRAEVRSPR